MAEYLSRSNNDLSDLDSFINESKTLLSRLQDEDESSDEEKMFVDHQGPYEKKVKLENKTAVEQPKKLETAEAVQIPPELQQEIKIKEENLIETLSSVESKQEIKVKEEPVTQRSLKSARRDDDSSEEEDHDRYVTKTRQRLSFHRRFESTGSREIKSPVSEPITPSFRKSPNYVHSSPLLSTSTPSDYRSFTSSSSSEGNYIGLGRHQQREVLADTNSLERNVSSLNIAQENGKNLPRVPVPTPTREQQRHTNSNSVTPAHPLPTQQNSVTAVDRFVPPAAVVRNGNHHRNGSQGYNRQNGPAAPDQPPNESDRITINTNEYTVLQKLGEGSSGKVFLVFGHSHRELYALKWIHIKRNDDRESILNEISLMKSLKDDTTIALLDHQETANSISIIMEYGEIDFALLIRKQHKSTWDVNFIRYYWNQMLHAVYVIHRADIVHSDLKPANFVVVKGKLKLIDFGIAKKVSDDTTNIQRDVQIGTINYMAPEALTDRNEGLGGPSLMKLGRPSDVWSLGCILYQMVYGATPFYHLPLPQKLYNIPNPKYEIAFPTETSYGDPVQKYPVPSVIIKLLKSCLDRDPAMRPSVGELLRHPFVYMNL